MKTRLTVTACLLAVILPISSLLATELKPIKLPPPNTKGGMPLMEALKARKSTRELSEKEIPLQVLSDLLWAAFGINRPKEGKRTAPSALNWQEIDIYVALKQGLYLYNAQTNTLEPVLGEDIRAKTGVQPFAGRAPVNLIYVADYGRMKNAPSEELKDFYSACDCGFIGQNVYLFCASAGLGTVVRAWIDRKELAKAMKLRDDQRIILAQTIGYPRQK